MTIQVSMHKLSKVTFEKGRESTWVDFSNSSLSISFFVPSYIAQELEAVAGTILKDTCHNDQNHNSNTINFHNPTKTRVNDFPTFAALHIFDKDGNSVVLFLNNKDDACAIAKAFDL